jgi:ketosteroid isomerase-like protein
MTFGFQSIRGRCAAIIVGTVAAMTGNASSDTAQLIANENAWAKAALDGDADRMASFMADEYVELAWESATPTTPAHWTATSKKEWVDAVRRRAEVYKSVDLRNITVHLQGVLAAVTGEYSQTGTNAGKDNTATGIYANTWVKRTGRWLVVESVFP